MKISNSGAYICPACMSSLTLTVAEKSGDEIMEGTFVCAQQHKFVISKGVPDFTWPEELAEVDEETRKIYEKLADDYEKFSKFPFWTFKCDEDEIREDMTNRLNLNEKSVVLEVGAGDGRGAEHTAKRLGKDGRFYVQELSPSFQKKSFERLKAYKDIIEFSLANASYLAFPDNYFDAAYHFGGLSTFSEAKRCLSELARVVKPGGKVLIGDESMGPWLRNTEFGKVMSNSNPLFKYNIPFEDIPVEARNVKVEWIMMGAYFLIEFTVGEGAPEGNYHIPIPSARGGTHWSRYYGNLEGISDETRKLAYQARAKADMGMSEWLDQVVKEAAKKQLED